MFVWQIILMLVPSTNDDVVASAVKSKTEVKYYVVCMYVCMYVYNYAL